MHMYAYTCIYLQQYRVYLPTRFIFSHFLFSFLDDKNILLFSFLFGICAVHVETKHGNARYIIRKCCVLVLSERIRRFVNSYALFSRQKFIWPFLTASRYPTGNCLPMDRIAASKTFPKGLQWRGHDKREIKASSKSFYDRTPRFRGEGFFSLASSLLLAATVSNILFSSLVHRIFSTLDKRCSVRSFFGWLATFVQIHIYAYT